MVSVGPRSASGGRMTLTRLPSGRRASTIGEDSSTRRPTAVTMRSITWRYCASSVKRTSVCSTRPLRSTQISSWRLHITSVTSGSASSGSSGPWPSRSARSSSMKRRRCSRRDVDVLAAQGTVDRGLDLGDDVVLGDGLGHRSGAGSSRRAPGSRTVRLASSQAVLAGLRRPATPPAARGGWWCGGAPCATGARPRPRRGAAAASASLSESFIGCLLWQWRRAPDASSGGRRRAGRRSRPRRRRRCCSRPRAEAVRKRLTTEPGRTTCRSRATRAASASRNGSSPSTSAAATALVGAPCEHGRAVVHQARDLAVEGDPGGEALGEDLDQVAGVQTRCRRRPC